MKRISVLILSLLIATPAIDASIAEFAIDNMMAFGKLCEAGSKATFIKKDTQDILKTLLLCTYLVLHASKHLKNEKVTRARQAGLFSHAALDLTSGGLAAALVTALVVNSGITYKKSLTRNPENKNQDT